MKRVLVIGPDFAPSSLPPALRVRFFVRHLPEFGWEPTVLTADPRYYHWPVDPENEQLLPGRLEIVRTPALPVRLTRPVGIGDIGMRALWHHWRAATALCRQRRFDLVFIPMPPYVQAVLGRILRRAFGIPYVIDYIDPWVNTAYRRVPRALRPRKRTWSYLLSRALEPLALREVSHLVAVSKGTTDPIVARYSWLTEAHATEIPYGGEPADFDYVQKNPRRNPVFRPGDGVRHLVYVGICSPPWHPQVRALFAALRIGRARAPELFGPRLRLHFVGTTQVPDRPTPQVLPLAREEGVEDFVDEHPARVPYLDALQILRDADGLIALGSDSAHYTASKIFPYVLAQKPLLALFHEASSVVRILAEVGAGEVLTYGLARPPASRVEDIASSVERLLRWPPGARPTTRSDAFAPYTTRAMAGRLAGVFDIALARRPGTLA